MLPQQRVPVQALLPEQPALERQQQQVQQPGLDQQRQQVLQLERQGVESEGQELAESQASGSRVPGPFAP